MKRWILGVIMLLSSMAASAQSPLVDNAYKYAVESNRGVVSYAKDGHMLVIDLTNPENYIPIAEWKEKYEKPYGLNMNLFIANFASAKRPMKYRMQQQYAGYKWRLKPARTVIGASLVGVSATAFCASYTALNYAPYNKNYNAEEYAAAVNRRKNGMIAAGAICGTGCLIGTIIILSGLYKDYDGIKVADNVVVSDAGLGASLNVRF